MIEPSGTSANNYRAAQQLHHQKILAQLLAAQSGEMVDPSPIYSNGPNHLGLSSLSEPNSTLSSPSTSMFQSTSELYRASTSSSLSTGSCSYLKTPHPQMTSSLQNDPSQPQNWDNIGWGEMTFGMVAQAQAGLAMQAQAEFNTSTSPISFEQSRRNVWSMPPQMSIDPGYLQSQPINLSVNPYQNPFPHLSHASQGMFAPFSQLDKTPNGADSPLRSLTEESAIQEESDDDLQDIVQDFSERHPMFTEGGQIRRSSRIRKRSNSDFILEAPGIGKGKARRLTWTSANDDRQREYEVEVNKREEERVREMKKFEDSNGKGNRKERRKLQNRLAQRAFRARSKIQGKYLDEHMGDLESLTTDQKERIKQLTQIVRRLQKENTALKTGKWAAMQGAAAPPAPESANDEDTGEEALESISV